MSDEFCAITGVDTATAAMYMEMSGYDLDTAIQLFFSMNDSGGGEMGGGGGGGGESAAASDWRRVAFSSSSTPEAWLMQGLASDVSGSEWQQFSILQHQNGPCGILAAYQAFLFVYLLREQKLAVNYVPNNEDVAEAISLLLRNVAASECSDTIKISSWTGGLSGVGGEVITRDGSVALLDVIDQYLSPGGVLLLLYSIIQTFGVEKLQQNHSGVLPLLYGPNHLCTSALMNIVLAGEAREALGAYDDMGVAIPWNKAPSPVGLLSGSEIELKMKIHDGLKFPQDEVYILHGRDHFTTLLVLPPSSQAMIKMPSPLPFSDSSNATSEAVEFRGIHYNGLPPAGPAVSEVRVFATEGVCHLNAPTAAQGMPKEYKPIPNTIDCIVQASSADKAAYPKEWKRWKYEIALAIDDPENQSDERPKDLPPLPTFSLNEADINPLEGWRCRLCFETRFSTMCFGQNDPGTELCQYCGRKRTDVGWTLWMSYDEIPASWQMAVDRQHGPKISTVLRTKWPNCQVEFSSECKDYPVV